MNNDLISREALKKAIESLVVGGAEGLKDYYKKGSKSDENAWIGGIYDAWELINNAPTVYTNGEYEALCKITDAEFEVTNGFWVQTPKGKKIYFEKKRPQGEWITKEHSIEYYCSHCGERLDQCCENFCCHCGAKMGGST